MIAALVYRCSVSAIDLTKHNIQRPDDCRYVGQHVTAAEEIHGREMGKRRRPDLAFVRSVGAVGDEIDAKLAFRRLDGRIDFSPRHAMAFAVASLISPMPTLRCLKMRLSVSSPSRSSQTCRNGSQNDQMSSRSFGGKS